MIRKVYLAGPMSHIPQFNYPKFFALAEELRKVMLDPTAAPEDRHLKVVNPAEFDEGSIAMSAILASPDGDPKTLFPLTQMTWGDYVSRALKRVLDEPGLDAICVMDGWTESSGARLETFAGMIRGIPTVRIERGYSGIISLAEVPMMGLLDGWAPSIYDFVHETIA